MNFFSITVFATGIGPPIAIGRVLHGSTCKADKCKRAIEAGQPWHAIPLRAVWDHFHFKTREEAITALEADHK